MLMLNILIRSISDRRKFCDIEFSSEYILLPTLMSGAKYKCIYIIHISFVKKHLNYSALQKIASFDSNYGKKYIFLRVFHILLPTSMSGAKSM